VLTAVSIGESPLMHFVEHLAGVAEAHYLLLDYPDEVNELFEAMHRYLLARCKLLAEEHPADLLYMIENTSTTLISPGQYEAYCLKHIRAYEAAVKAYGRDLCLHMCGKLKDLFPALSTLRADAFEAFTAPPVGDTTLLDGRRACPDTCLVGGTSAVTWTKSAAEIIAEIKTSLDELPHHRGIVVTSAGVMPPLCAPETIKEVCDFVKAYPAKF
jgi:uroporphyrinogen-III decarboxylase